MRVEDDVRHQARFAKRHVLVKGGGGGGGGGVNGGDCVVEESSMESNTDSQRHCDTVS